MIHTLWRTFRSWEFWTSGIIWIGLLLIATRCGTTATSIAQETPPGDRPPEVTGFTLVPRGPVLPNARIGIQVNVNRNGHRIDNYRWVVGAGGGSIVSGQGTSLTTYEAPENPGAYKVRVELEYEGGPPVEGTTIVVVAPEPTPPPTDIPVPTTPTDTPSPNTPTPTPTARATPTPPPSPTPSPQPDVVVNTGLLNLRSGPSVVYDILGVLKRGDSLKVTGRDLAGEWLRVIASDGQEGWVTCSLLQVNVDVAGVPVAQAPSMPALYTPTPTAMPTPELLPPPIPLAPANGECFIAGSVNFRWRWDYRPLRQDELFSLRVYREGETETCHHNQVDGFEHSGGLTYCSAGKHYWRVALVRKLEGCPDEDDEKCWENLSEPSEKQWIYYAPPEEDVWEPPGPPEPEPKPGPPPKP